MSRTFYITTAISYANGSPHIGHAYEAVAADAIARFKRLDGYDVMFQTGTDEYGLKMAQMAADKGLTPQDFADRHSAQFQAMCQRMNVSHDRFIRTTEPEHHAAVQNLWRRMEKNGDIYPGAYAGWYSVRDEAFYDESETTIGPDGVRRGGQGTPVEWTEEKTYFFKLSAYQDRLLRFYADNPDFIGPETRRNEVVSFVKGGLNDLSISRTAFQWGVPVPDAPGHVMYVWVDALTNYMTGCGFPDESSPRWKYWPADVHVIGKDIVRFHAVYWPAFLMSAGLPLPKRVFGHGFLLNRGEKMSKSIGNVVDPFTLTDEYGVDQLRYFFLREVSFGQDGNYSHDLIVNRINADLANDLGNLAQRSLSMIAKNCSSVVPQSAPLTEADAALFALADVLPAKARSAMQDYALHTALSEIWTLVAETNRYFASQEPWMLRKTDPVRMEAVLYVTIEVLRRIGILVQPFIPEAAGKLLDLLGAPADERSFAYLSDDWALKPGAALPPPAPIFPRYVEADAEKGA